MPYLKTTLYNFLNPFDFFSPSFLFPLPPLAPRPLRLTSLYSFPIALPLLHPLSLSLIHLRVAVYLVMLSSYCGTYPLTPVSARPPVLTALVSFTLPYSRARARVSGNQHDYLSFSHVMT